MNDKRVRRKKGMKETSKCFQKMPRPFVGKIKKVVFKDKDEKTLLFSLFRYKVAFETFISIAAAMPTSDGR